MTRSPNYSMRFYVSLRSDYRAGRIDRRRNLAEPGARARHDPAQAPFHRQGAGAEPPVRRVSEVFRGDAEAGERDSAAADFLVADAGPDATRHSLASPAGQKIDQFLTAESCFPQQRHQGALWQVAIVTGHNRSTPRGCMEKDEVTARGVIQNKPVPLQKTNDLAWFDRW